MIETRASGKLYVVGEYAVVEPGQPAVLVGVDRFLTVRLTEAPAGAESGRVHSNRYGRTPLTWSRSRDGIVLEHEPYDYVFAAIAAVEQLRSELGLPPRYFDLDIGSELDDADGRKFGLGSSAAVTVATVTALNEFYNLGLTRTESFKLALLATIEVAPNASGGDLAASVFGGWIRYTSPDREALRLHRSVHGVAATLTTPEEWQGYGVNRLAPPEDLRLLIGWTGTPASTERLVNRVHHTGRDIGRPFSSFLGQSRECVDALVECLGGSSGEGIGESGAGALDVIKRARHLLQLLGSSAGVQLETARLRALCDIAEQHGAAAKPSGAGGGDCGIVLADADLPVRGMLREWEAHDIRRLSLSARPAEGGTDGF
ncbi:MAG: phosphomevalonate kinase [Leucobacter sp.]